MPNGTTSADQIADALIDFTANDPSIHVRNKTRVRDKLTAIIGAGLQGLHIISGMSLH
jgi:hypothetical protein